MTAEDFRRLALDMQGVIERAHMGHPDFRANGRIFASIHSEDRFGMVKLEPSEQRELMNAHPKLFAPSSGAWGRQGCTNVRLDARSGGDEAVVRGALLLAWTHVMEQRPPRKRAAKPTRRRA